MARVPVSVVSGFLGSGKTRLVNHLLRQPAFAGSAVIVNELGETGIDQMLYEVQETPVALLENGCLCCSLRSGLPDALSRLERRRRALGHAPFGRLVLETSGYADPGPVLQDLFTDPVLAAALRLDSVIVTADVLHLERQIGRFAMCARQLALADRIVLTMADLAPHAGLRACRVLLRERFPRARVYTRAQAHARPERLLDAGLYEASSGRLRPRNWLGDGALAGAPAHAGTVQSFVVRLATRPRWVVLQQWLGALIALRGEQLLRLKGIVRLADHPVPVAVHAVHHRLHAPVELARVRGLPRASTFVFVTDGLTREEVQASLAGWGLAGAAGGIAKQIHRIA